MAKSRKAVFMHGGLCADDLQLEAINQRLPSSLRCELTTVASPYDEDEKLVRNILWSGPTDEPGLEESDRGAGMLFGPDVANDFLTHHGLQYIIRANETCEDGFYLEDMGDDKAVITVFSTASYRNGEGSNDGAVIFINDTTGEYNGWGFNHHEEDIGAIEENGEDDEGDEDGEVFMSSWITSIIDANMTRLTKAFQRKESSDGKVKMADILSKKLDLPDLKWQEIQPEIAPTNDENLIDW